MYNTLTTMQAAEIAGVSRTTIFYWIKKGYLGNISKQNVTRGSGCGYAIREDDFFDYITSREYFRIRMPLVKLIRDNSNPELDKTTLRIMSKKLQATIEAAQEELAAIQKLL